MDYKRIWKKYTLILRISTVLIIIFLFLFRNRNNFQLGLLFVCILYYNFHDFYRLRTMIRNRLVDSFLVVRLVAKYA
mgnify:CR=1 FL=1